MAHQVGRSRVALIALHFQQALSKGHRVAGTQIRHLLHWQLEHLRQQIKSHLADKKLCLI